MTTITQNDKSTVQTVTGLHWYNDRQLTFTTTKPEDFSFAAGQYARLGLNDAGGTIWRAYSMTSAPQDEQLEFYGILVPDGLFTTLLKDIQTDAPVLIEKQVYGFMTPDRFVDGDELWMLATGTGIGPFISMLRDPYVWQKFRNLVIVHGVRHADEFSYRDMLRSLQHNPPVEAPHARQSIIETLTRDPVAAASPGVLHGRITTLLENGLLEKAAGLPITADASRIMMCGNPDMIEDTRRLLHQRGMRPCRRALPGQFVTENYW
jgi:ferredoxin--NADP+ reductase